jgi:hypothetical protein
MTVSHSQRTLPLALNSADTTYSTGLNLGWDFTADDASHKDGVPWLFVGATAPTLVKSGTQNLVSLAEPGVVGALGASYDYTSTTNYGWQDGSGDFLIAIRWTTQAALPSTSLVREVLRISGTAGTALAFFINENNGVGWYSTITGSTSAPRGTSSTQTMWGVNKTIVTLIQRVSGVVTVYDLDVTAQGNLITRYAAGAAATTQFDSTWAAATKMQYGSTAFGSAVMNNIWHWNKSFTTTELATLGRDMYRAQANSAVSDALAITSPAAGSSIGQTSVISGTYTGTVPQGIEVQFGSNAWVLGTSATIGSGTWSATFSLTPGSANTLTARASQNAAEVSPSIANITVDADSIAFTQPSFAQSAVDYRIFQRDGSGNASVRISGTYVGSPTSLEYRWNGGAWAALGGTMGSGAFDATVTLAGPAQGDLSVRFANKTTVFNTLVAVGVGDVYMVAGQSNHVGAGAGTYVPPVAPGAHPAWAASILDKTGRWRPNVETSTDPFSKTTNASNYSAASATYAVQGSGSATNSYFGKLATQLMAFGVPVAFVPCALGSTSASAWAASTSTTSLYGAMLDRANNIGGHKAVLWWQGEGDCAIGTARSTYESAINAIINDWCVTRFPGKKWVLMNINAAGNAAGTGGTGASDTGFNAIHAAIAAIGASNANVAAVADMNGLFSALHYSTSQEITAISAKAYDAIVGAFYAKHATLSLVDGSGNPRANLTGLKWAFFDQSAPDGFAAPSDKGTGATTNASGVLSLPLVNTSLSAGGVGFLVVSDTDGTTTQSPSPKAFAAPVTVA